MHNGLNSGCYNCEKRHVGCHSICEAYADFVKRNEELKKNRKKEFIISNNTGWSYRRQKERKK